MVGVVVNRPVRKDDVGFFSLEQAPELLIVSWIDDGLAIDLASVGRARGEDLTCLSGLGYARPFGPRPGLGVALIEVEENYVVPQVGIACNSATAAIFRVTWVPSRYNDFK